MGVLTVWNLLILLGGVLIVVAIVAGIITARRARKSGSSTPVVGLTLSLAGFVAALSLVGAVVTLVNTLTAQTVRIVVPVQQYWPSLNPGVTIQDGPTATVRSGGFDSAEVDVEGLSTAARVTWAAGQSLGLIVPAAIAALIAVVCFQLLRGAAFAPVVARAALVTAVVVLAGGLAGQLLDGVAGTMASQEILTVTAWAGGSASPDIPSATGWPLPVPLALTIDFWPIGAALALAALASVFRYGSRLQRDTEGLV